jgi:hypothetical protein
LARSTLDWCAWNPPPLGRQAAPDLLDQSLQVLDDRCAPDRALVRPEAEVGKAHSGNSRPLPSVGATLDHRRFPLEHPGAHPGGALEQPRRR